MKTASAKLLSVIEYPLETIYLLWAASRSRNVLPSAKELHEDMQTDPELRKEVNDTFVEVIKSDIPVAENLDFIFVLDNVSISLREQIVRHRIGHRFGEQFAVDIIPGEGSSSYWSQSMRIMDMGSFAATGDYYTPESIANSLKLVPRHPDDDLAEQLRSGAKVPDLYRSAMGAIASLYAKLVDAGIPPEDARNIIPLAASHRISWKLNYMSIKHILGRRGCWIAQLGMWKPIILDMVNELATKVHPIFRKLVSPPCLDGRGNFCQCPFVADNLQRLQGLDPEPPCAAFLYHHPEPAQVPKDKRLYHPANDGTWDATSPVLRERYQQLREEFSKFWGRSAYLVKE